MAADRFGSVLGAAWGKSAMVAQERAQEKLVHPDHCLHQLLHEIVGPQSG
jgi:hypothetical protein